MKNLTTNLVMSIYNKAVNLAQIYFRKTKYMTSLSEIEFAAKWMYHFNQIYSDNRLEHLLNQISDQCITHLSVNSPTIDNVVFIDNFGYDNRGLTQQYLRGLMAANKRIIYILHNSNPNQKSDIIYELKEYNYAEIKIIKTTLKSYISDANKIVRYIMEANPKNILFHIAPWDVVTCMSLAQIKGVQRFNINLTDHAFWLGTSVLDINLEFRGYGKQVSLQKRGLPESKLIFLPYYPIVPIKTKFQGLPALPEDAIVILCGGSEYKMLGKNDIFFKLMDEILNLSSKAYIIVAGINKGSVFDKKRKQLKNMDRIILIGNRKDINEVFAHSDIFLSSYPFIGGLMTQYAAINSLPILAYAEKGETNTCDEVVNHFFQAIENRTSVDDFLKYAYKLISDVSFRKMEGELSKKAMVNVKQFNSLLNEILTYRNNRIHLPIKQPDYGSINSYYLKLENNYLHNGINLLVSHYKLKTYILYSELGLQITKTILRKLKHKYLSSLMFVNEKHIL